MSFTISTENGTATSVDVFFDCGSAGRATGIRYGATTAYGQTAPASVITGTTYKSILDITGMSPVHFQCFVDAQTSDDQVYTPGDQPATAVAPTANPTQVAKGQVSVVTAIATASGSPTAGRTVNFSIIHHEPHADSSDAERSEIEERNRHGHGNGHGNDHHPATVTPTSAVTDGSGSASCQFVSPKHHGKFTIQASCDTAVGAVVITVQGHA